MDILQGNFSTCENRTKQNTWVLNKMVGSDNPLFTINIKFDKALGSRELVNDNGAGIERPHSH